MKCDFHIHTLYLKCANETMTIPAIFKRCEELGVEVIGISDHLNTPENLPLFEKIKHDIETTPTRLKVYFGCELDLSDNIPFDEEVRERYGFEYTIGGVHGAHTREPSLRKIIDIHHDLLCKSAQCPLFDVVVHPWWFSKVSFEKEGLPWFEDMDLVPFSYTREFAQIARDNRKAIEINASAVISNVAYSERFRAQYLEHFEVIKEEGVRLALGSDAHKLEHLDDIFDVFEMVERLAIPEELIWLPSPSA